MPEIQNVFFFILELLLYHFVTHLRGETKVFLSEIRLSALLMAPASGRAI